MRWKQELGEPKETAEDFTLSHLHAAAAAHLASEEGRQHPCAGNKFCAVRHDKPGDPIESIIFAGADTREQVIQQIDQEIGALSREICSVIGPRVVDPKGLRALSTSVK